MRVCLCAFGVCMYICVCMCVCIGLNTARTYVRHAFCMCVYKRVFVNVTDNLLCIEYINFYDINNNVYIFIKR